VRPFPQILLLLLLGSASCRAQQPPLVAVKVSQVKTSDGSVRYVYRAVNHASTPFVAVIVGRDYYQGTSDLVTPPTGWTFESGLPISSVVSPAGWHAAVVTTEESRNIEIEWRNDGQTYDIGNGQTRIFSVLVGMQMTNTAPPIGR
jgi:hypothetical protein